MRQSPRVRRALTLHAYWKDGDLVVENFATRIAVSADPITIEILNFFGQWRQRDALIAKLPQFGAASIRKAVNELLRHSLLVEAGSEQARLGEAIASTWKHWLPHGSYHFATKDAPFASPKQWARMAREFRAVAPQPALIKEYPRLKRRRLPAAESERDQFLRVLLARKTHREFSKAPLPLQQLATLLHYTWGAMGMIESPNFGPLLHKTSPSGGARHPGEVYVAALRVDGLAPGLYHYNIRDHSLELLKQGPMRREVLRYALGQEHVGTACAVFFMTAAFPRTMYKYRSPRAYRIVTLETGHLAQTFCLVATWLGLAPFTTAAVADTAIEQALGLDGVTESMMYVAGVGVPSVTTEPPAASTRRRTSASRQRRPTRS